MPTVALLGTLDTKGEEYGFLKRRIEETGCGVVVIDVGVLGEPRIAPDIGHAEVAAAVGADIESLRASGARGSVVTTMGRGAGVILARMAAEDLVHAVVGMGGSGGTSVIAGAMHALPIGFPKLIVSTMASGDTRAFVGGTDITLMHSVVDISGLNRILKQVLGNAAASVAAMARAYAGRRAPALGAPVIGATMFGVTSPGVTTARCWLEAHGYEVLVFHATGSGGSAMEALMRAGLIFGALDVTTTELVDELVGGVLSAGPGRLETAGALGLPQIVSLGALDIANFGPIDTVPERFRQRNLYEHNPAVTLMRTNHDECARLGEIVAGKLGRARGPVTVFIPRRGFSALGIAGGVFHDPDADGALVGSLIANLDPSIEVVDMDTDVNDPGFATAMAECLDRHYREWTTGPTDGANGRRREAAANDREEALERRSRSAPVGGAGPARVS